MIIGFARVLPVIFAVYFLNISGSTSGIVGLPLVGQVEPSPVVNTFTIDWQSVLGTMGVTGVLVWYLWYTTSAAFPKVRQDFRDEMNLERAHHEVLTNKATDRVDKLCGTLEALTTELKNRPCIVGHEQRKNP